MSDIEARVRRLIVEQLDVDTDKIKQDASFSKDLGADSLDQVELVMAIEEEFNIEIPDDAAEKIVKVQDAIDYIKTQLKKSDQ